MRELMLMKIFQFLLDAPQTGILTGSHRRVTQIERTVLSVGSDDGPISIFAMYCLEIDEGGMVVAVAKTAWKNRKRE